MKRKNETKIIRTHSRHMTCQIDTCSLTRCLICWHIAVGSVATTVRKIHVENSRQLKCNGLAAWSWARYIEIELRYIRCITTLHQRLHMYMRMFVCIYVHEIANPAHAACVYVRHRLHTCAYACGLRMHVCMHLMNIFHIKPHFYTKNARAFAVERLPHAYEQE